MLARSIDGGTLSSGLLGSRRPRLAPDAGRPYCHSAAAVPPNTRPLASTPGALLRGVRAHGASPCAAASASSIRCWTIAKQERSGRAATSAENIEALITAGTEEGLIEEDDRKLIQSVVAFGDKVVREVMTPRPNMVTIQADQTLEQLRELVVNEQYSRIPVYQTRLTTYRFRPRPRHVRSRGKQRAQPHGPGTDAAHPVRAGDQAGQRLMREMQQEGAHMVIVVDEYGNTAGLATMEDLVEVILGEIRDEHEPDSDVTEDGKGGYIVSGNFDIARVARYAGFPAGGRNRIDDDRRAGDGMAGPCPEAGEMRSSATAFAWKYWRATRCAWNRCA